jgi:F-type H+-transporting ATPase subunit b
MNRMPWALVATLLLASATPAYAAQEAGPLDVNVGLMIWTFLMFGLVLFALYKFAWPNILGAVERREQHIAELLEQTGRDREEAAALLAENRRILEETRHKVQEAINDARTGAEKIRAEMLEQARREQEDLMARTRRDIASERESMMDSVRRETVDLAIAAAGRLVRSNLDTEGNRKLVTEYLGQLAQPVRARA